MVVVPRLGRWASAALVAAAVVVGGCQGLQVTEDSPPANPQKYPDGTPQPGDPNRETLFGPGGLFSTSKKRTAPPTAGIGVNGFLWRASLDTLSFMPLASADPFGGVIITDWYAPPEAPNERFKMTVYILDRTLRADAIKVAVFRQLRTGDKGWVDSTVDAKTAVELENAILTRARQLRVDAGV